MAALDQTAYISSVGYSATTQWAASHAYTVGQRVRQLAAPSVNNERIFICAAAGTSGSSEPAWNLNHYIKTTDGSVSWYPVDGMPALNGDLVNCAVWTPSIGATGGAAYQGAGCVIRNTASTHLFIMTTASGVSGSTEPTWNTTTGATTNDGGSGMVWTCLGAVGSFAAWSTPCARVNRVGDTGIYPGAIAGATFWVADNHAETSATSLAIAQAGGQLLCVDRTASLPVTSTSSLRTTASVVASGSYTFGTIMLDYQYGIQFTCGSAGTMLWQSNSVTRFDHCGFALAGTSGVFQLSFSSTMVPIKFEACTFSFSNAAQKMTVGTNATLRNCVFSGTGPTNLFDVTSLAYPFTCEACDLGIATGTLFTGTGIANNILLKDCKLGSGVTVMSSPSNISSGSIPVQVDLNRCDSAGATRNERWSQYGKMLTSTAFVRTGGASDGTTRISHSIGTAAPSYGYPFSTMPLVTWNSVIGANRNVSLYGLVNDSRLPTNGELWFDVEYLGSSSSPLGSVAYGSKGASFDAGSALSADSASAWDSGVTTRANSHAYSVGDAIKTASNPGRVFFCTIAGTSASSEPAGGSVSGNPIFDAANKGADIVLSSGNLVAGCTSSSFEWVRATGSAASGGKYYFEVAIASGASGGGSNTGCGLNRAGTVQGAWDLLIIQGGSGQIWYNGSNTGTAIGAITGHTVCCAVDLVNNRFWARVDAGLWNNSGVANPATNTGGIDISTLFSGVAAYPFAATNVILNPCATANFGATTFAQTVPSGFSAIIVSVPQMNYGTAVDGASGGDGGAAFRAGYRFSQTLTLSAPQPQQAGYLYVYPKISRPSMTYYLDPLPVLS